mmetsp:Transcript_111456/g.270773  ORF Transcript_111456/g.270773 Transcript_111456/m.270773 type:complete len:205 (-) Transcript_111456:193-807(-)
MGRFQMLSVMVALAWHAVNSSTSTSSAFLQSTTKTTSLVGNSTSAIPMATACSAYPKCVALGLTSGACCPGDGPDGQMLECCEGGPTACSAYPGCAAIGLTTGTCCAEGSKLDCCSSGATACSAFQACQMLGLKTGACCPTAEGSMLDCCAGRASPRAQCKAFPACAAANLTEGACCPTPTGVMLDCCNAGDGAGNKTENAKHR